MPGRSYLVIILVIRFSGDVLAAGTPDVISRHTDYKFIYRGEYIFISEDL